MADEQRVDPAHDNVVRCSRSLGDAGERAPLDAEGASNGAQTASVALAGAGVGQ